MVATLLQKASVPLLEGSARGRHRHRILACGGSRACTRGWFPHYRGIRRSFAACCLRNDTYGEAKRFFELGDWQIIQRRYEPWTTQIT